MLRGPWAQTQDFLGRLWADRALLRRVLMIGGVSIVAAVALVMWLMGGRYVSTDDAYIQTPKLMVSTDVSGLVQDVDVHQGDHVKKGQVLFRLDPAPFRIAVNNAKAAARPDRAECPGDEGRLSPHAERYRCPARAGRSRPAQLYAAMRAC